MKKSACLLILFAGFVLGLGGTASGQDNRVFVASGVWSTTTCWSPNDVPNTATEAAVFDDAGLTATLTSSYDIGQIRVANPSNNVTIANSPDSGSGYNLYLYPSGSFGGVGLDMSSAQKNFTLSASGKNTGRKAKLWLKEDQQWNVTGSGNISCSYSHAGNRPAVNLESYTLTANVGSGRIIDFTNGYFYDSGGGSIIKTGDGELRLGMANTYTGDTTIHGGTLTLTDSGTIDSSPTIVVGDAGSSGAVLQKSSGTFNVGSTQTLKGIGTVIGDVSVAAGGTLAPGASAGTLTLNNNLTLADGALLGFELASIGASDMVSMSGGTLTLNGQEWGDSPLPRRAALVRVITPCSTRAPSAGRSDRPPRVLSVA